MDHGRNNRMERMGHTTNNMLKTVYQHTMKSEQEKVAELINGYFEKQLGMQKRVKICVQKRDTSSRFAGIRKIPKMKKTY